MADGGVLRVVSAAELSDKEAEEQRVAEQSEVDAAADASMLHGFMMRQWEIMRNHRTTSGLSQRIIAAQRAYNGEYSPEKLADIKQTEGSEVYARITTSKVSAATALLRDVYMSTENIYEINPTPDPELPGNIDEAVVALVQAEVMAVREQGIEVPEEMVMKRMEDVRSAAERAAKKTADKRATKIESKVEDILIDANFYRALKEFLDDIPKMPFAVLKGPFFEQRVVSKWEGNELVQKVEPTMCVRRTNPSDFFWMPGARSIRDTNVIERGSIYRHELQRYIDVVGFDEAAIREALRTAPTVHLSILGEDYVLAELQERETPSRNQEGLLPMLAFQGMVPGHVLLDWGVPDADVLDEDFDYAATVWWVNGYIVKATINPNPRRIHIYSVASWRKQAGSPAGFGIPDLIDDLQQVCNATLRALVNNMAISSGPQVVVNANAVADNADITTLYPWKRWYMKYHPMATQAVPPVSFFQPQSNAAELLGVYEKFVQIADDVSAIPRYMTGNERIGGAGRTASGLAMMLGNASKVLQDVIRTIDDDVLFDTIQSIYDYVLLTTDDPSLRGDAQVKIRGVTVAIQREAERMRQIEFLQYTANPIDMNIMGIPGRANVLRSVAGDLGLDGGSIVPSEDEIMARMRQQTAADQQEQQALNAPAGGPVQQVPGPASDAAANPRRNIFQQQPQGG